MNDGHKTAIALHAVRFKMVNTTVTRACELDP